jgi:TPR repeat protein
MAVWVVLFLGMLGLHLLGPLHPGNTVAFWVDAARRGVPTANFHLLERLLQDASDDSPEANAQLGLMLVHDKPEKAAGFLARATELGSAEGATNLAVCYVLEGGARTYEAQVRRALEEVGRAADAGDARSCFILAAACEQGALVPRDRPRSIALLERASDAGFPDACAALGQAYLQGVGLPRNHPRAAALFEKAGDGGNAAACAILGDMLRAGDGVARDEKRAYALTERACELGYAPACQWLALRRTEQSIRPPAPP